MSLLETLKMTKFFLNTSELIWKYTLLWTYKLQIKRISGKPKSLHNPYIIKRKVGAYVNSMLEEHFFSMLIDSLWRVCTEMAAIVFIGAILCDFYVIFDSSDSFSSYSYTLIYTLDICGLADSFGRIHREYFMTWA